MRRQNLTPIRAAFGLTCVAFVGLSLGACDLKKKDKDDAATAAPAPAPAPAPVPDPNAAQPAQPAGAPPAGAPPAAPAAGGSPQPQPAEWAQAARAEATNAAAAGCEVKQLREWIRVACGQNAGNSGAPVDVAVSQPGLPSPFKEVTGSVALIYPFLEGQDLAATFVWQKQARGFTSKWAQGTPQPPMVGAFGTPIERRVDQCDNDRDCGAGWQCCLTASSRGLCKPAGRNVCQSDNLYTKCSTDAECRREQGSRHVCQYNSSVGAKVCKWDRDGSRKTLDDQGDKRKKDDDKKVVRPKRH